MAVKTVRVPQYTCEKCGHEWLPRIEGKPISCPKCKSPTWDRPRSQAAD